MHPDNSLRFPMTLKRTLILRSWVTDVTEFKYGTSFDHIHKLYLSVILDLCDHRPVAYVLSDHNNNQLVFDTFNLTVKNTPGVHPIFHSDYAEKNTMPKNLKNSRYYAT